MRQPAHGQRWSHWALRESWLRGCKVVGVEIGLYAGTKHSAATAMLNASGHLEIVRRFLGHADSKSTRRYAQITLTAPFPPTAAGGAAGG